MLKPQQHGPVRKRQLKARNKNEEGWRLEIPTSAAEAAEGSNTWCLKAREKWLLKVFKSEGEGLPWWRSGWESTCQCRGCGFEPWSGKIPHAAEQLGPWATAAEPAHLEPVLRNGRGHDGERPAHRDEEWPPLAATRESPRTETKTQRSQK